MIPTVEEFLNNKYTELYKKHHKSFKDTVPLRAYLNLNVKGRMNGVENNFADMLIEFTKLHVEAALKAASEKALVYADEGGYSEFVDESSILNTYPLENIK